MRWLHASIFAGLMSIAPALVVAQETQQTAEPPQVRELEREASSAPKPGEADALSVAELEARARARELGDRAYHFHKYARRVSGDVTCPEIEVVEYEGALIRYNRPIEINKLFRKRLMRFEQIVAEVAIEVYGRAPDVVVHAGGHHCKTVGGRGEKLSEHAFGHAIDVAGFDFNAVEGESAAELGEQARGAFEVRLEEHWGADEGFAAKHARFLRRLAEELKRRGPFSAMLGPAYKGHDTFFHFDFGPQFFFRI